MTGRRSTAALCCVLALSSALGCSRVPGTAPMGAAPRAERGESPKLRFVQMADTQFGFFSTPLLLAFFGVSWTKNRFARETSNFEEAMNEAVALDPRFIVVCGDLVNSWGHEGQAVEFERIRNGLRRDVPVYVAPGNHDVGNKPTRESLEWYRSKFGPDYYAFEHDGLRGIVLNSSLFVAPERVPDAAAAQLAWLDEELARTADAPPEQTVVFLHYPLFLEDAGEDDSYFNVPAKFRGPLLERFAAHGVRAVFAGHYHRNAYARAGGLEMITTGAVGRPLGGAVSGYRVVDVYDDGFDHRFVALDGR